MVDAAVNLLLLQDLERFLKRRARLPVRFRGNLVGSDERTQLDAVEAGLQRVEEVPESLADALLRPKPLHQVRGLGTESLAFQSA